MAEVDVISRDVRMECNGFANQVDGFWLAAALCAKHSQKVQRIRTIRMLDENLAIDLLRIVQPTGPLEVDRCVQPCSRVIDGIADA